MAIAPSPDTEAQRLAALLFERHAAGLRAFCLHRLRDADDADEAVQATFLRALRALRQGVRPYAERAWLLTIARNVCASVAAEPQRRVEVQTDPVVLADAAGAVEEHEPLDDLDDELVAALAALPDGQRRALLLRGLYGLTYRDIARELDVTVAAVETWIFRARRSLASTLGRARRYVLDVPTLSAVGRSLMQAGPVAKAAAATVIVATATVTTHVVVAEGSAPSRDPAPAGAVGDATPRTRLVATEARVFRGGAVRGGATRARGASTESTTTAPVSSDAGAAGAAATATAPPPATAVTSPPDEPVALPPLPMPETTLPTVDEVELPVPTVEPSLPEPPPLPVEPPPLPVDTSLPEPPELLP